jgi:hypothetical protein
MPQATPVALAKLTELTGSQASTFWALDAGSGTLHPTFVSINFERRAVEDYLGGMAKLDPTVRYLLEWHERSVETRYRLVAQSDLGSGLPGLARC